MSTETTEHTSDHYVVRVEREPGCLVTFSITVSPQAAKKEHEQVLKEMNKQVSLPGFRKGRAPKELIVRHYGQYIEKDWKEALLQNSFREAMYLANVFPLSEKSVRKADIVSCSLQEGCKLTVKFEAMPDVPEVDLAQLLLEQVDVEPVTEKKIEQIIEDIRYRFAEWEKVEGRPVEEGDFVDLDIEDLDQPGNFICRDTRLEVAKGKIGKWLLDLLIGMNIGESREAQSTLNEELGDVEFKSTRCRVTVKGIFKSILPNLDEAFAEKAGVKSVEELRSKVTEDLATLHKKQAEEKRREHLKARILATHSFDVPASLIDAEAQQQMVQRVKEAESALAEGASLDKALLSEMQNAVRKEVEEMLRWQFIAQNIARKENISVDQSEVSAELLRYLYSQRDAGNQFDFSDKIEGLMESIRFHLMMRKVADFLLSKAE